MGRTASTGSGKTTLLLDERLKLKAAIFAMRRGWTLTRLVEEGLRLVMAQKPEPDEKKS